MFEKLKNFFKKLFTKDNTALLKESNDKTVDTSASKSDFSSSLKYKFQEEPELENLITKIKADEKFIFTLSQEQLDRLDVYYDLKLEWIQNQIDINKAEIAILEGKINTQKVSKPTETNE